MRLISFKVAKALKEAGYPQIGEYWYDRSGLCCYGDCDLDELQNYFYAAPYVLEVWLWLWRKKKVAISTNRFEREWGSLALTSLNKPLFVGDHFSDPEEAIIAGIEYLVDNNLIK